MIIARNARFAILIIIGMLYSLSEKQVSVSAASESTASVTVSFDSNGGESDASDMIVTYGGTYGELPEVTRENYVFQGWYTFRSGGSKVTAESKVFKPLSHTLHARWRGEATEITLDANGGTLATTTAKVYFGSKFLNQLPTPTKDSYVFDGWYTEASSGKKITIKSIFDEKSEKTLYAHWIERQVRVVFVAFNGERYEKYVSYGMAFGELPEPERKGHSFGGWYKYRDYTNYKATAITAETVVKEVGQIKLLARWYIGDTDAE